jgi:LuxR family maltose regulon positive regulatory protein
VYKRQLYYAWALFMSGAPFEEVEAWLPRLEAGVLPEAPLQGEAPQAGEGPLPAAVLIHAFVAAMRGEMREARRLGEQALNGLGPDDQFWRSMAVWVLSISYHDPLSAPLREGLTWEDAAREARESGNLLVMVSAMCEQGHDYKRHGRLHDARDVFARALALATPSGGRSTAAGSVQRLPIAGEALMGLAEIDLEWNKLQSAEALLDEGLALTRQWREIAALPGCFQLARLRRAQGDQEGAEEALREAARLALLFDATDLDDVVVAAYQARLGILQGRPHLAQAWAVERGLADLGPVPEEGEEYATLRYFEELILSRLWMAEGELEAALQLQDRLLSVFGEWQHVRLMIETLLLRAQVHAARGEMDQALTDVREALILGEPEGFVRVFLDEGKPMLRLLGSLLAAEQGPRSYLNKLAASFDDGAKAAAVPGSQPLIEPLTERELEILQLVAEGLSNREIGQRLYLSLPTVKWHTSNIYGKLGVKNRTTAVAKARELGLLSIE